VHWLDKLLSLQYKRYQRQKLSQSLNDDLESNLIIFRMKPMSRIFIALIMVVSACSREKTTKDIIDESLSLSLRQYSMMADVMKAKTDLLPRSVDLDGMLVTARSNWWTSGFLPGSLWYLYEYSNDPKMKDDAELFTKRVEKEKNNTGTHDLGFMLYCSFGNGLRLTREESYNEVLMTGAKSLSTRFRPEIGCIQSWGSNSKWQYPVIIDNMMNLELLMWAFKNSNDSSFYKIAVTHADTTMKNHFRQDYSSGDWLCRFASPAELHGHRRSGEHRGQAGNRHQATRLRNPDLRPNPSGRKFLGRFPDAVRWQAGIKGQD
jgi:hypothetical protein